MSYVRVNPRDFFNESKLLKCMGQLSLKAHDNQLPKGVRVMIEDNGEPYDIRLTTDGRLFIHNYPAFINDVYVSLSTTYNSENPYPLICFHDDVETTVFDNWGNFTDEFYQFAQSII